MKKKNVLIHINGSGIEGDLTEVQSPKGIILFAHGSGSSRHSTRNMFVAEIMHAGYFSTLLFDLLTPQEDAIDEYTAQYRFNIPLLAERVIAVTQWLKSNPDTAQLPIGYFGASTGAAAALIAAADSTMHISAIVSRGGRPDLAYEFLEKVTAPTLLIVGAEDTDVIALNKQALTHLRCVKELCLIPGATHLFEEPGTLKLAAEHARDWFKKYVRA